ncbi:hypothetical protein [Gaetbulibacter aestuarii]|uniref:Lipoprotein n=1 Tax=Gaetbulibacter aestuarii TaxID=1502358 RepID=A0ABW7N274_9FLAO
MKKLFVIFIVFTSCAVNQKSNIKASEEFIVELKRPASRGGLLESTLQVLFSGANYLAKKSSKTLTSSYSQSISINDYYTSYLGETSKTYNIIVIKKFSKPVIPDEELRIKSSLEHDLSNVPKTRGQESNFSMDDIIRMPEDDLLNFQAVIELISDKNNPGVTRLSFNELRVLFSKTKVFADEDLNARVSVSIEGQWRNADGSPKKAILIEQEYDFKNLKYGFENQISEPILSPWYYDIPIVSQSDDVYSYGVVQVNIRLEEYEGSKSKFINKLPSILSENKNAIIKNGASTIRKL